MLRRYTHLALAAAAMAMVTACSQGAQSPVSPSAAAGTTAAAADGSTLKVTAPAAISPTGGERLSTRRPVFTFSNSTGKFTSLPVAYRLELLDAGGNLVGARAVSQGEGAQTVFQSDVDLANDTTFQWRVRAEYDGQAGPWSGVASFVTPVQPVAGGAPSGGGVGPQRSIGLNEAVGIIIRIHNDLRIDLGSRSSREFRVDFINAAVAAIHYGHARFNSAGPDPSWCVKDAGGGRPQSDDVLALCRSRDAWDLIGSAGANGYFFHQDYLGVLPGIQNVYPPPVSALNFLNR